MAGNDAFQMVDERGWKRGLGNLVQGEFSSWFRSSRWWKHILIWFSSINVMMIIMAYAESESAAAGAEGPPILFMYGIFGGMFVAFGVMIIMQRVIVGEKRRGTAAWVLSKPVTRTAFVVSRLIVNCSAILLTSVLVPGVIVYVTIGALTAVGWLSPLGFLAGVAMIGLHTLFWLTLTLMMGTFLESSGGVIGIPIALFFALWFVPSMIPQILYVSPLMLAFSPTELMNSLAISFMTGTPVFSWLPLISTVVFCIAFVAVAIGRFNRQEF